MNRHRRHLASVSLAAAAALVAVGVSPAQADTATQTVTGTTASMVSISTSPTASVDFGTLVLGANTKTAGQIGVGSNAAYTVTVAGLKSHLTKYTNGAYDDTVKLASSTLVLTTLNSGAGVPVASVAVGTTATEIASGTGLTTDVYDLTLSQSVLSTDAATTYRNQLTYTAAATL